MFKNHLITAIRNLQKNLTHSLLNTAGLSVGMGCVITVFAIIDFEYSFDDWHMNKDKIYRYTETYHGDNGTHYDGVVPYPTGKVLKEEFPEIKEVIEFHGPTDELLSFNDDQGDFQIYREENVLLTGASYFKEMNFEIIEGNIDDLDEPMKLFLTENIAKKYFPNGNALGKTIKYKNENNMEVAGVLADPPANTNMPFNVIVSIASLKEKQKSIWNLWHMTWAYSVMVVLNDHVDIAALEKKIDQVIDSYSEPDDQENWKKTEVVLQPLAEIHTEEKYGDGYNYVAPSLIIYAFVFLGALILGTAILNFVNLNTAIAIKRSKEIGVRKTLGSRKSQLIFQFMTETFLLVVVSVIIGLMISQILTDLLQLELDLISYRLAFTTHTVVFSLLLIFVITFLAGIYPALVLAGYSPIDAIKNTITLKKGAGSFNIRRSLIVTQFVLTTILIICSLIIAAQMDYVKNREMGFDYENVVLIDTPHTSDKNPEELMNILKSKSYVKDACLAFGAPLAGNNWNNSYGLPGEKLKDGNNANMKFADENYLDFYGIELLAGKNYTNKNGEINDTTYNVVVNMQLIATLGWRKPQEAIGRAIKVNRDVMNIVGVVDDFTINNAKGILRPVILYHQQSQLKQIALKLPVENLSSYIDEMNESFKAIYPYELFEMEVLKNQMDGWYIVENLLLKVIQFMAILSVLLSAMGLYGMVSYMANRNAKVIGIRKVFGASTANILSIFTKEYLKLILIAFFIAGPSVYFLIQIWLEEFVYRIDIGFEYFLGGFAITLVIALSTVVYRSYLAAKANPISSIRYE